MPRTALSEYHAIHCLVTLLLLDLQQDFQFRLVLTHLCACQITIWVAWKMTDSTEYYC